MDPMDTRPGSACSFQASTPTPTTDAGQPRMQVTAPVHSYVPDGNHSRLTPAAPALKARVVTHSPVTTAVPSAAEVAELLPGDSCCTAWELAGVLDLPLAALYQLASWDQNRQLLRQSLLAACPLSLRQLEHALKGDLLNDQEAAARVASTARRSGQPLLTAGNRALLEQLTRDLESVTGLADRLGETLGLSRRQMHALRQQAADSLAQDQRLWVIETACNSRQLSRADWLTVLAQTAMTANQLEGLALSWQLPQVPGSRRPPAGEVRASKAQITAALIACADKDLFSPVQILELGVALDLPAGVLLSLLPWRDPQQPVHHSQADSLPALGEALALDPEKMPALQDLPLPPPGWAQQALQTLMAELDPKETRTCEQWLAILDLAGCDQALLHRVADYWQTRWPADSVRGHNGCQNLRPAALALASQDKDETTVPLSRAWQWLQDSSDTTAFRLLLGDASDPHWYPARAVNARLAGLTSLLRLAARQASGLLSLRQLRHMARFGQLRASGIQPLPLAAVRAGSVSRPWHPSDLVLLVAGAGNPEREALEVAALLGVGEDWGALQSHHEQRSRAERALCTWRRLYNRLPGLETGHLVALFQAFGKGELVHRLTGNEHSRLQASCPLADVCGRAAEAVALAHSLQQLPEETVRTLAACCRLDGGPGYLVPEGTGPALRLLNSMAQGTDEQRLALIALLDPQEQKRLDEEVQAGVISARRARENAREASKASSGPVTDIHEDEDRDTGLRPPRDYLCPIMLGYMENPVAVAMAGSADNTVMCHFEQEYLRQCVRAQPVNPLTREDMSLAEVERLKVDRVHLARIEYWRSQHPELEESGQPFVPGGLQEEQEPDSTPATAMDTREPPAPPSCGPETGLWVPEFETAIYWQQGRCLDVIGQDPEQGLRIVQALQQRRKIMEAAGQPFTWPLLLEVLRNMQTLTENVLQGHQFTDKLAADEQRAFVQLQEEIAALISQGAPYVSTVQLALLMGTVLDIVTARKVMTPLRRSRPELWREHRLETFDFHYGGCFSGSDSRIHSDAISLDTLVTSGWDRLLQLAKEDNEDHLFAHWTQVRTQVLHRLEDDSLLFLPTFASLSEEQAEGLRRIGICPLRMTMHYAAEVDGLLRSPLALLEHDARQIEPSPGLADIV